ncbi:low molecular weight phosphotyrosine protein phosphatase [Burkholderia cepacia]|uniref:protein-tyrosine-phosphatase n=1 Tax=Burkholderia cepacia TaxID=292 RepID=A0AAQ0FME6_BURCE|nr:low molecular weight protein-tyrosine-phosphatase [Burkholderia cepacia]RAQ16205.1 low molecular weight phosphotyrosine protein phosphatase [Burkholderia cepacia]
MSRNVLIVCIGNICRSPMGEGLLRVRLPDAYVASAGTSARVGEPAHACAVDVAAYAGIDISAHRAQQLNATLVRRADIVLTMDLAQRREIVARYPFSSGKVFRLGEQEGFDVPDPYLKPASVFRDAYTLIERGVNAWVPRIAALG